MTRAVGLLTSEAYPQLSPDDQPVQAALREMGVRCEPIVWTDPLAPLDGFPTIVLRSCWDYHLQPALFDEWITTATGRGIALWNPPEMLRWNSSKRYLLSLAARGVSIVPTALITTPDDLQSLSEEVLSRGNGRVVIKPEASANAFGTIVAVHPFTLASRAHVRSLLNRGQALIQPFLREIQQNGEHSLVFLDGRFSHCVIKRPHAGDFRVQEEHGGTTRITVADDALLGWARDVVALLDPVPLYCRVDAVTTETGPLLMELELIEPTLHLRLCEGAAEHFAKCIVERL